MAELFVDVALRATVILAAALIATIALRRAPAATRHLVWTLALAGVLALPAMRAALPRWEVLPGVERSADALRQVVDRSPERLRHSDGGVTAARRSHVAQRSDVPRRSNVAQGSNVAQRSYVAQRFSAAFMLLWAAVALLLLARLAYGVYAVRRIVRHARPAGARSRTLLQQLTSGGGARIRLLESRDIAMPMTWGTFLLLPADAAGWSEDRVRVVLLHELAHIHRADWITHALGHVTTALHWFNPLAWAALRAMTRERERACDDYVLAHGARAAEYAQHLLDIAKAGVSGAAFGVAPAMARPSELEGRLLSILTPRRRHAGRAARAALPLAAAIATGIVAAAAPAGTAPQAAPAEAPPQPRPRTPMNGLLGDPDKGNEPPRPDVQALTGALEDPSSSVRESAALALALRSSDAVVDPLLRALKDRSSQVREKAAMGLAMRQQPRVVDALIEAAHDPDSQVREKVIIALGLSGEARVQKALIAALEDPDEQVREKAAQALAAFPLADAIRGGIAGALKSLGTDVR